MKNITNISNGSTITWKAKLLDLSNNLIKEDVLAIHYKDEKIDIACINVHLAIFNEPFLSLIFEGKKTIESRFSKNRINPFEKAKKGDIIFIKKSGSQVLGFFVVGQTYYYHLPKERDLNKIKNKYSEAICSSATVDFWESRNSARYISLLEITETKHLQPFNIDKRDRMAWVTLNK